MQVHVCDGLTGDAADIHTKVVPAGRTLCLDPCARRRDQIQYGLLLKLRQHEEVALVTARHDQHVTGTDREGVGERRRKFVSGDDEAFA